MVTTQMLSDILIDATKHPDSQLFIDSLSIAGIDGTMRNRFLNHPAQGQLYLKTGTLNGVRAIAGYVNSQSGSQYTVVTIQQHSAVGSGRGTAIQNVILDWAYQQ
jgi:D-alanyl-D-alanine carboxypeptidase/D-alanyl-D-alanine-endopeptidase (penicillin-binding protein 4)